jgi:DNA-binding protein YbaB
MADGPEHRVRLEEIRQRLDAARRVRAELATLVGSGQSPDGLIRAEFTDAEGLTGLTVNPRAMRLDSTELAERILATVRAARADLEARKREVAGPEFDPAVLPDPDTIRARLDDAAATFQRTSTDVAAVLDLLRRTGRTDQPPDDPR